MNKDMNQDYLDVSEFFPKSEFIYYSEVMKAIDCIEKSGYRDWWKRYYDKIFMLPFNRSDSFRDAICKKGLL